MPVVALKACQREEIQSVRHLFMLRRARQIGLVRHGVDPLLLRYFIPSQADALFLQSDVIPLRAIVMDAIIRHLAVFISRQWQIHAFGEGNTRTTAVFFIKYLRTLGFDVTNDIFAENAWYFRNALVRANYNDLKNGIHETTEYLELFLRNLLLNEDHPLQNRTLHISAAFNAAEKPDIEESKSDIEKPFRPKTARHILKLREAFPGQTVFGRSDVMGVIDIKPSRASELLADMVRHDVIEPVSGHGKGKYRFKL